MKHIRIVMDNRNNKYLRRFDYVFATTIFVLILLFYFRSIFIARSLNISVMACKTIVVGGAILLICIEKIITYFIEKKIERKNSNRSDFK